MNNITFLTGLGLTQQESRTYLALLDLGEGQIGEVANASDIASSNLYYVLKGLAKKGLVSHRIRNNRKVFMPSAPEALAELVKEKEESIKKEKQDLSNFIVKAKKKSGTEDRATYKYYEGMSGVKGMWHEITAGIPKLKRDQTIKIYAAKKEAYSRLLGSYEELQRIRKRHKIPQLLILPKGEEKLAKKRVKQGVNVKLLHLKNEAEWGVIDDMFFIHYIVGKTPKSFLIKDKVIARTFDHTFKQLWK